MANEQARNFVYCFFRRSNGSKYMNVDGSVTPVHFDYVAPKNVHLTRVNFSLVDDDIHYGVLGGLPTALTNGILIKALDANGVGVLIDFLEGEAIRANEDFANLAGIDATVVWQPGASAGDNFFPIRWTLAKAGANLQLHTGQRIRITIQDNLTGLSHFTAMVQGHKGRFSKGA